MSIQYKVVKGRTDNEGDLRVWFIINPPNPSNYVYVKNVEEAIQVINAETEKQLLDESIDSNAFGLQLFENGEWGEWYNDEGECIDEVIEHLEEVLNKKIHKVAE